MSENKVVIGASIVLDSKPAEKSVGSFRKELREANEEMLKLQKSHGEFSKEAITAAKRVAELKDTLGDARSLVDTFNPDKKFAAFGQSVQGVVGGFTALQGVMGLVNSESEAVNKALLKVQSALAISQGIDQVMEAVQGFKNLGTMIRNSTIFIKANEMANKATAASMRLFGASVATTSTSFKVLKGAIIATGIGALLILVGELISYFDQLGNSAGRAAEKQKEALQAKIALDKKGRDAVLDSIDMDEKIELSRAKLAGKSGKELLDIQQKYQRERITARSKYLTEVATSGDEQLAAENELKEAEAQIEINHNTFMAEEREKALDKQKRANEKAAQETKRKAEELKKQQEQAVEAARKLNKELDDLNRQDAAGEGRGAELEKLQQEFDEKSVILQKGGQNLLELQEWYLRQRANINKKFDDEEREKRLEKYEEEKEQQIEREEQQAEFRESQLKSFQEATDRLVAQQTQSAEVRKGILDSAERQILTDTTLTEEQRTSILYLFSEARKQIDRQEAEAKAKNMEMISGTLKNFSDLAGRQTAAGKALAVAAATMDTFKAANQALATYPPPFSYIAMAGAIASGIKNVKEIIKVQIPGGGGSGINVPSIGSSGNAPLQPQAPGSTVTSLDRNTINQISNQAVRAFVIESDVTTGQERIRRINRAARLG
jgi:hypothetical protein